MQLIGFGSKSQACAELAHRVIEVAHLKIGDSQILMHRRVGGSLFHGPLVQRDRFLGFPRLDEREAKIGQCWYVMRICSDNLLKQRYSLLLLPAGLERESKLILCIEGRRSERESTLQNRDGFLVLSVGNQSLGELNLSESALRRKLGRGR